jgi:hypothetical protein
MEPEIQVKIIYSPITDPFPAANFAEMKLSGKADIYAEEVPVYSPANIFSALQQARGTDVEEVIRKISTWVSSQS